MDKERINTILKQYDYLVKSASNQFPIEQREDTAQDIRIWLYGALQEYADYEENYPLVKYIRNQIGFCLRRLYFDVKEQEKFERQLLCFHTISDFTGKWDIEDYFDDLVSHFSSTLSPKDQTIFFSLLHNTGGKTYKEISEILNIDYSAYRASVAKMKKMIKIFLKNH